MYHVFDILLKWIWYIFIIRIFIQGILYFFFPNNMKSVQQALQLIATHINDKALHVIMLKKNLMHLGKGLKMKI